MTVAELMAILAREDENKEVSVAVIDFGRTVDKDITSFLPITHCTSLRETFGGHKGVVIETHRK